LKLLAWPEHEISSGHVIPFGFAAKTLWVTEPRGVLNEHDRVDRGGAQQHHQDYLQSTGSCKTKNHKHAVKNQNPQQISGAGPFLPCGMAIACWAS
jgi:hypothetical protein